jgi:glycosyltransferase involved in cell wall biosynthesis
MVQTESDWELVIVNDCSTDGTLKIAESYARSDSRIHIISNETNQKLPASLNEGFARARGKYFTWTSDDNIYKPNALKVMARHLDDNPNLDFVTANMDLINEDGEVLSQHHKATDTLSPRDLILGCNISAAFMYRKALADRIGVYDTSLFCAEDYDFWCRAALNGNIAYINDNIYQYRKHGGSLTATKKRLAAENKMIVQARHLDAFCERFHFSDLDRLKIAVINKSGIDKSTLPFRLRIIFPLLKLRKASAHLAANLIFWNKPLRRKIRRCLSVSIRI